MRDCVRGGRSSKVTGDFKIYSKIRPHFLVILCPPHATHSYRVVALDLARHRCAAQHVDLINIRTHRIVRRRALNRRPCVPFRLFLLIEQSAGTIYPSISDTLCSAALSSSRTDIAIANIALLEILVQLQHVLVRCARHRFRLFSRLVEHLFQRHCVSLFGVCVRAASA